MKSSSMDASKGLGVKIDKAPDVFDHMETGNQKGPIDQLESVI